MIRVIEDGYTREWNGYYYRPLTKTAREFAIQFYQSSDWEGLDFFIWSPPFFFGDNDKLTDEDRRVLFLRMMDDTGQEEDFANLKRELELLLSNPRLAIRTCGLCRRLWFDEETQLPIRNELTSEWEVRPSFAKPACETTAGCGKGHWGSPVEVSKKTKQVLRHYLLHREVGATEHMRNCGIIQRNWLAISILVRKHGLPKTSI